MRWRKCLRGLNTSVLLAVSSFALAAATRASPPDARQSSLPNEAQVLISAPASATSGSVQDTAVAGLPVDHQLSSSTRKLLRDEESLQLTEYQLTERVERRIFDSLKSYGTILGIVIAFVGFLGIQVLIDVLTRRIEGNAKKEVDSVREKMQAVMLDLELALRECRRTSALAEKEVETIRRQHAELEDLSDRYLQLHAKVQEVSAKSESASTIAAASQEKTDSLNVALNNTFAGDPAVFTASFDWKKRGRIGGINFGETPGKVVLLFNSRLLTRGGAQPLVEEMAPIEVNGPDIIEWSDTGISFQVPDEAMAEVTSFKDREKARWASIEPALRIEKSLGFKFLVERTDGLRVGGG